MRFTIPTQLWCSSDGSTICTEIARDARLGLYGIVDVYQVKIITPKTVGDGITGVYFSDLGNQNKLSLYGGNLTLA